MGHRKPVRIHWKADEPKMNHCLVRILVQTHNWDILLRKWANEWPSEEDNIGIIWFQQDGATCHTAETTLAALNNWTFRRHRWGEYRIKTLLWRNIKSNRFRSWSQLTIQWIFASLSWPVIDLQKMPILAKKKIIFSDKVHCDLDGHVNNKIVTFGAQKTRTQNESLFDTNFGPDA